MKQQEGRTVAQAGSAIMGREEGWKLGVANPRVPGDCRPRTLASSTRRSLFPPSPPFHLRPLSAPSRFPLRAGAACNRAQQAWRRAGWMSAWAALSTRALLPKSTGRSRRSARLSSPLHSRTYTHERSTHRAAVTDRAARLRPAAPLLLLVILSSRSRRLLSVSAQRARWPCWGRFECGPCTAPSQLQRGTDAKRKSEPSLLTTTTVVDVSHASLSSRLSSPISSRVRSTASCPARPFYHSGALCLSPCPFRVAAGL